MFYVESHVDVKKGSKIAVDLNLGSFWLDFYQIDRNKFAITKLDYITFTFVNYILNQFLQKYSYSSL